MLKQYHTLFWNIFLAVFLVATYYYFSSYVTPILHYHSQYISFLWGNDFFNQFSSYPGGIADYAAIFLMQFLFFNWAGSLIITLLILILILLLQNIIKNIFWNKIWPYLFASLIIIISSNYLFHLAALVKLILVFSFVTILSLALLKRVWFVCFVVLAVALYYLAGGAAIMVFAISAAIIRFFISKNIVSALWALACLLIGFLIPFFTFKFLIPISFNNAFTQIFPKVPLAITLKNKDLTYVAFLVLPLLLFVKNIAEIATNKTSQPIPVETDKKLKPKKGIKEIAITKPSFLKNTLFITSVQVILISIAVAFAMNNGVDIKKKNIILTDYYSSNEDWKNALETSLINEEYDYLTNIRFNRALYHCNLLGEKLFDYPQRLGSDALFPDKFNTGEITLLSSDFYFDLGYIAESQHWAYEAITVFPYNPQVLKRIVLNNLIMGDYELAKKFLNVLGKNFLYKDWANQYLKMTVDTSLVSKDLYLSLKRKSMPENTLIVDDFEKKLLQLLAVNPNNKMAYEYLMVYYLLNIRLGDFAYYLPYIKNFNKTSTPKIFEEALALYLLKAKEYDRQLDSISISQATKDNFRNINKLMVQNKNAKDVIMPEVRSTFGQTFWCYVLYDNPKVTKSSLKTREVSEY